jgi:hypothetical protein
MNERIRELVKEADEYASQFAYLPAIGHPSHIDKFNEKFAELIVKECMSLCLTSVGTRDYNTGRIHCHDNIKKHFGVAE